MNPDPLPGRDQTQLSEPTAPPSEPLAELIARQPFCSGLSQHHLDILANSAMEMPFATGETMLEQGSPANRFYLILHGRVCLELEIPDRPPIPIQTLGAGDDLGWAWLFPPYYLHLGARALEPTHTIFFYGTRLREQCELDHEFGYELMRRIAGVAIQYFQATQQRLLDMLASSPANS